MQKPKTPENEVARLSVLKKYNVLDTLPEKLYDNITYLASQICGTPIALVSLIDEERQWFKSHFGLDATYTPREVSFCGHAILENKTFQIPDSSLDPRFSDNPLVTGNPKVAFYAGAPLKTPSGYNIGTLCVIDNKPRQPLTPEQIHSLELLAEQVVELFEMRLVSRHATETTKDLAETLESMHDAFFSVDKNWIVTHVNQKTASVLRTTPDQLVNQHFLNQYFSKPEQRETISYTKYIHAMQNREPAFFEGYNHDLKLFSEVKIYPKADGGLAVFFKDITKEKDASRALMKVEASFQSITEATPLIVWTSTPEGHVDYANSKWYEYTGYTQEQTFGFNFANAIHPDDKEKTMEVFGNSLSSLEPLEIEHRFQRIDGSYRWFLTRALPSLDASGVAIKWFGTNIDIHDQKLAAVELNEAKAEAEHANLTKSAFLANMSHEIRTPLGAILGFTDLLKQGDISTAQKNQFLDTISRNGKALTRIIDDILDLAKVESGKMEVEKIEFSLLGLMDDVMSLFRESLQSKGLYLRSNMSRDIPSMIVSDPTRLRQIFINILGNAVKFTEQGGVHIDVSVHTVNDKAEFKISVSDTGIGLTPEHIARLFKPFMQADNTTTRRFGGTGLGLDLSKRLANALGGNIEAQSNEDGKGSNFIISFSALISKNKTADKGKIIEPIRTKELLLNNIRVLSVDDAEDNQTLIGFMLRKHGALIDIADNGKVAVDKALSNHYDIVLMDMQMPIMDGYEATRVLREKGYKRPIVALTAHAMIEEKLKSKQAGCDDHVTKPLDQAQLLETILRQIF